MSSLALLITSPLSFQTLITSLPPGSYLDCLHLLSRKLVSQQKLTEASRQCPKGVSSGGAQPPVMWNAALRFISSVSLGFLRGEM